MCINHLCGATLCAAPIYECVNITLKCGKTCNVCDSGEISVRGGDSCQDQAPTGLCENWKSQNLCSINAIKFKCAKTCDNCI